MIESISNKDNRSYEIITYEKTEKGITVDVTIRKISNGYIKNLSIRGEVNNDWFSQSIEVFMKTLPKEMKDIAKKAKEEANDLAKSFQ